MTTADKKLHVAIIMDGNGRWAKARGKMRPMGHKAGMDAVRRTLEAARSLPIRYLTLYSFSTENWSRPEEEVSELMGLLRFYLKREMATFLKEGIRFRVIGERRHLPPDIRTLVEEAETKTAQFDAFHLTLALSYGGRQEIVEAAKRIAIGVAEGRITPDQVDEALFEQNLMTQGLPDPDLIIRTSGEQRISNFLLWQSAYAEYVFPEVLWPDFGEEHLRQALDSFFQRDRRFGTTGEKE